ncbi:MAG: DUF6089 family protein [Bacteroidota bacterium]
MRKFLIVILFILLPGFALPQYNLDYGINLGASNYLGEMGGTSKEGKGTTRKNFIGDMKLNQTRFSGGVWARYRIHPLLSAKASLMYFRISGADSLSDYPNRNGRNLSFRNDIYELSVQAHYNFYSYPDVTKRGRLRIDFGSYVYVGVGGFYHNPKARDLLGWEALQPLGTEGQGRIEGDDGEILKKYSRVQLCIPFGLGFYYTILRKWRIGLEFGYRKTFTDYLDDASTRYPKDPTIFDDGTPEGEMAGRLSNRTPKNLNLETLDGSTLTADNYGSGAIRGDPTHNDAYMYTGLCISYVVRGKGNFYRSQYKFITGAKKRRKRKTRAKF